MKITINEDTSFLITDEYGDIVERTEHGLYEADTRFLSSYNLAIGGFKPILLSAKEIGHSVAIHHLANPPTPGAPANTVSIVRKRLIGRGMHEDIDIINHNGHEVTFQLELSINSDFADIFEVKTESVSKTGTYLMQISDDSKSISFNYSRESFIRKLTVVFSAVPSFDGDRLSFDVKLESGEKWHVCIDFMTLISDTLVKPKYSCKSFSSEMRDDLREGSRWLAKAPKVQTSYDALHHAYEQSLKDIQALIIKPKEKGEDELVLAAGLPWFMTFFGRDTLITSYQTILVNPAFAKGALRSLARYQGNEVDGFTSEEPGKILHEIRFGELGAFREIPQLPYYGTADATPLFLILLSEVFRWTGDVNFLDEMKVSALKALEWIDSFGDLDNDGYVEYHRKGKKGLANQGWKDSGDSVRFRDGRLATSPIALCEVQGYCYDAKVRMAELLDITGDHEKSEALRKQAVELKSRFNRDFWLPERNGFCMALDRKKEKVDSLTSNMGHLLWSGIVESRQAKAVADHLLSRGMFSGWGIRTMSTEDGGFNPISYHNGSVWPHDNSIIAEGLVRYGFLDEAKSIVAALLEASKYFAQWRLPELFCGYAREDSAYPVEYPSSCSPQAWASGAIILLIKSMMGLSISVPDKTIVVRPAVPETINEFRITGIPVADDRLDLGFENRADGTRLEAIRVPAGFNVRQGE